MLSAVKMDLYRMRKTRSFWGVLIAMILFTVWSVAMTKMDTELPDTAQTQEAEEQTEDELFIGIGVTVEDTQQNPLTAADEIYAHFSSKLPCIFICIFAVMFSVADFHTGFIKAIGGQVEKRGYLIISKGAALAVFTAIATVLETAAILAASWICFPGIRLGAGGELAVYLAVQFLQGTALAWIIMAFAVLTRSSVVSVSVAVCLCVNIQTIFYSGLNRMVQRLAGDDFDITKYTVTGNIFYLPMYPAGSDLARCILTAAVFMAAALAAGIAAVHRRDI